MNSRIRMLRNEFGLSQTSFAEKLGMTRSMISNMELSLVDIPEYFIKLICQTFKVNRRWLETGEGEMFAPGRELDQMMEAINDSPAMRSLLTAWSQLNEDNKAVLEEFIASYVADYNRHRAKKSSAELQKVFDGVDMDEDQRAQEKKTS